jgi:hypothetical protein
MSGNSRVNVIVREYTWLDTVYVISHGDDIEEEEVWLRAVGWKYSEKEHNRLFKSIFQQSIAADGASSTFRSYAKRKQLSLANDVADQYRHIFHNPQQYPNHKRIKLVNIYPLGAQAVTEAASSYGDVDEKKAASLRPSADSEMDMSDDDLNLNVSRGRQEDASNFILPMKSLYGRDIGEVMSEFDHQCFLNDGNTLAHCSETFEEQFNITRRAIAAQHNQYAVKAAVLMESSHIPL